MAFLVKWRRVGLGMGLALAVSGTNWAATSAARRTSAAPAAVKPEVKVAGNALLPGQVEATAIVPELGLLQKMPMMAPAGWETIYSDADWEAYRRVFGVEADGIGGKKASQQLDLAQRMFDAAGKVLERRGLNRLLMLRVVAIGYRNKEGSVLVGKAIAQYQAEMDLDVPTEVGGLWQMADVVARYSATPKELRPKYSLLAAKANVQLAMLLLDGGQVQAAAGIIKMLGRHEPILKTDPAFKIQANNARALVGQTAVLMDEVAAEMGLLAKGDQNAPMQLYLYGKFVAREPYPVGEGVAPEEIVLRLLEHAPGSSAAALEAALKKAQGDVMAAYDAGEMLKAAAEGLPEGILKHRVLHGAREEFAAYLKANETDGERVKRTLARIGMETVVADGAAGQPRIRPLEGAAATQGAH